MELTLNLCNQEISDISYKIFHFPDGEVQIELEEISHKNSIEVITRITNAEELFIVLQVADILNRQEIEWKLTITYLMSMRMDRVMSYNRPYSLKVVANLLKGICKEISILEPHSTKTINLLDSYKKIGITPEEFHNDYTIVIPDEGADERYKFELSIYDTKYITCSKVRDLETGRIISLTIDNPELITDKPLIIVDDLCDGGGTFCLIAEKIREINPNADLNIAVTHAVNAKGLYNLSKNFNKIIITDSYKDWINEYSYEGNNILPENIEVRNCINYIRW